MNEGYEEKLDLERYSFLYSYYQSGLRRRSTLGSDVQSMINNTAFMDAKKEKDQSFLTMEAASGSLEAFLSGVGRLPL
jgi:hypothetical protein